VREFRLFLLAIFVASLVVLAGSQFAMAGTPTNLLAGIQVPQADLRPATVPATPRPSAARPTISFSDAERMVIADHYGASDIRLVAAPRIARNAPLPRGVSYRPLPVELDKRLPPVRRGYARVLVGSDIGLVELNSLIVVDVLPGIAG